MLVSAILIGFKQQEVLKAAGETGGRERRKKTKQKPTPPNQEDLFLFATLSTQAPLMYKGTR